MCFDYMRWAIRDEICISHFTFHMDSVLIANIIAFFLLLHFIANARHRRCSFFFIYRILDFSVNNLWLVCIWLFKHQYHVYNGFRIMFNVHTCGMWNFLHINERNEVEVRIEIIYATQMPSIKSKRVISAQNWRNPLNDIIHFY